MKLDERTQEGAEHDESILNAGKEMDTVTTFGPEPAHGGALRPFDLVRNGTTVVPTTCSRGTG